MSGWDVDYRMRLDPSWCDADPLRMCMQHGEFLNLYLCLFIPSFLCRKTSLVAVRPALTSRHPRRCHQPLRPGSRVPAAHACVGVVTMSSAAPSTLMGPSPVSTAPPPESVTCTGEGPGLSAVASRRGPAKIRLVQYAAEAGGPLLSLLDTRSACLLVYRSDPDKRLDVFFV